MGYKVVTMNINGVLVDDGTAEIHEDEKSLWMTREEVAQVCPPCAEKMEELGFVRIRSAVLFNDRTTSAVFGGCCSD